MSMSKFFLGAAAVLALAGTAYAVPHTYRSSLANGAWNDVNAWEYYTGSVWQDIKTAGIPVPASGDTVTIRSSYPILVSAANAACAQLTVDASGVLTVNNGYSLTLDSGGAVSVSGTLNVVGAFYTPSGGATIGGVVDIYDGGVFYANGTTNLGSGTHLIMEGTSSKLTLNNADAIALTSASSVLWVAAGTATIDGSGSLNGQNASASIAIGPASGSAAVQVNNEAVVRGSLTIKQYDDSYGTSAFANVDSTTDGFVIADGAYSGTQLLLDATLDTLTARTNDSSGSANAQWQSINGGTLVFGKVPSAGRYFYQGASSTLTINVQFAGSGINSTHGTVNGSQSTYFLANTPTY